MNNYSQLKIFHYPNKLKSLKDKKRIEAPIHVRIKPINACNHHCWYCAYKSNGLSLGEEMSVKDVIPKYKMLEIIHDLDDMRVQAITFSGGGEPLLYPHMKSTLNELSQTNIKFGSLTNGSLLKGELAELFSQRGSWVRISLDGWDDESYSKYRGVQIGAFTELIQNIKSFTNLNGRCLLGVSLIIDKDNRHHIKELTQKLIDSGVKSIKFSPCIVSDHSVENNQYHAPYFKETLELINEIQSKYEGQNIEIYNSWHKSNESFSKKNNWCPYQQILTIIGADLNVYQCQDKAYKSKGLLGSIKRSSFKSFWMNHKEKFFKTNPSQDCLHHCVSHTKNSHIIEYLETNKKHLEFV